MEDKQQQKPMTIHERISSIMDNVGAIAKSQMNHETRKNFRGKEDFLKAFQPHFQTYGVTLGFDIREWKETVVPSPTEYKPNRVFFRTTIWAKATFSSDTGSVSTDVLVTKNDFGDFGPISAMSFAITKALEIVFCVPTEEPEIPQIEASQKASQGPTIEEADAIRETISGASLEELKKIWDDYPEYHRQKWFTSSIWGRKAFFVDEEMTEKIKAATVEELTQIVSSRPDYQSQEWFSTAVLDRKKALADEAISDLPATQKDKVKKASKTTPTAK